MQMKKACYAYSIFRTDISMGVWVSTCPDNRLSDFVSFPQLTISHVTSAAAVAAALAAAAAAVMFACSVGDAAAEVLLLLLLPVDTLGEGTVGGTLLI